MLGGSKMSSVPRAVPRVVALAMVLAVAGSLVACEPHPNPMDDLVHLNQIQVVGSHNSYHLLADPAERELRRSVIGDQEDTLEYSHPALPVQFSDQRVRQIELDVFDDPDGGLYSDPLIRQVTSGKPMPAAMSQPGMKVLHVQDVDYHSNCLTLIACLKAVRTWSNRHSRHAPIAILLELKDTPLEIGDFPFVVPKPFDVDALNRLDAEIRSVFSPDEMITPDDIRGSRPTLEEAVLKDGWPTLGQSRGKVMFLMDNGDPYRSRYLEGHPSLRGRVLFTNANPGDADAAFVERNDAIGDEAEIRDLVAKGYVVRTRSDADTAEARTDDGTARRAAFRSGAQWVSTDYPFHSHSAVFTTPFHVTLPNATGAARCDPVNAPVGCNGSLLDPVPDGD
jgi:hypothetical protein